MPAALRSWTSAATLLVLPLLALWAASAALAIGFYGNGLERAGGLLAACGGVLLLRRQGFPGRQAAVAGTVLVLLLTTLVGLRTAQALDAVREDRVPTVDVGTTTVEAVRLLDRGEDPYTARLDAQGEAVRPGGEGLDHVGGYKYGPVMTLVYGPGVRAADEAGYFVTSLVALLALAAAAAACALRAAGPVAGVGAACLVLAGAFLDLELFQAGVNDVVPMALATAAVAARARGGWLLPGLLVGLSAGGKLLPAGLVALVLVAASVHGRWRLLLTAVGTALACYLPPLLTSPQELVGNLVLFNLVRDGDGTGLLDALPSPWRGAAQAAMLLAALGVVVVLGRCARGRQSVDAGTVAGAGALATALLLLGGPVLHRNYFFWVLPLVAVALAARCWGSTTDETTDDTAVRHLTASC